MKEPDTEPRKSSLPPPHIPPPSLAPPPPPPLSPLERSLPASDTAAPASVPAGGEPVKVKIRTVSDALEEEDREGLAPFNPRVIAFVIDVVVTLGLGMAAVWLLPAFAEGIGWLVGIAYLVTRDSLPFLDGQSVGKKAMKLRAVTASGASLSGRWEPGLIRNGVLAIPFFALVELYILLTREDKPGHGQRLGDEWAKTKVIAVPDEVPAE
jgi:uncharacterized RDD family membrane protein YckC